MSDAPLIPAVLAFAGGVPYAQAFDDLYHSAAGGLEQARYVFVAGNDLPARWQARSRFVILETGFGLGLNFLATWQAWQADSDRPRQLHYVAIEKHPFRADDLAQLHAGWPELAALSEELRAAWPPLVPGFHRVLLAQGTIVLTLIFGDITDCIMQVEANVDAFYLDGFSPSKNPDMWQPRVLKRLGRLASADATLATYTVSADVRRSLTQCGFICEKRPGFGFKRDMLGARFAPHWPQPARRQAFSDERSAIVIGAGLAGSAACQRLASRGWHVTLIERHARPAQEASGNLAGIFMPLISKDDSIPSRLTRAAYLFTLHLWRSIGGIGHAFAGEACGVLQLARDAAHAETARQTATCWNFPVEYARWLEPDAAAALLGQPATNGGWLFPQGGWAHPAGVCDALLAACGDHVRIRFMQSAGTLERNADLWQVYDDTGALIAQAPVVILAGGTDVLRLPQAAGLPLTAIRGQVTHVPADMLPTVPLVVCGEGYLTRASQSICSVGASYDFDTDPQLRQGSQAENLEKLKHILPATEIAQLPLTGRVGFRCVAPDRLPLAGALPDYATASATHGLQLRDVARLPGLYGLMGFASRGLIWAALAAELVAAQLDAEPLPIESELAAALDPARFLLKKLRVDNH